MKRFAQTVSVLVVSAMLATLPVAAAPQSQDERPEPFGVALPLCVDFLNFVDGIEVLSLMADNTVTATWQNYDGVGSDAPMLGGFAPGSSTAFVTGATGTFSLGDTFGFVLDINLGTFDLLHHDSAGNVTLFQDDSPFQILNGACPFAPETGAARNLSSLIE